MSIFPVLMETHSEENLLPPGPSEPYDLDLSDHILSEIHENIREFGEIYKIYSPFRKTNTYVITHADYIQHVLVKNNRNYTKGVGIEQVKLLLGNGIFTSEGDYWRSQRRLIQPAFHRNVIVEFSSKMVTLNTRLLEKWHQWALQNKPVNITDETSKVTLQTVLDCLFSLDLKDTVAQTGKNPFDLLTENYKRDLVFALSFKKLGALVKAYRSKRIAEDRIEYDFLSMIMESRNKDTGEPMTEKEVVEEALTLVVAGHETTASVLNFLWWQVATHPAVAEKLYEESSKIEKEVPGFEDIPNLPYTRQIINEVMRLYPPGWLLSRRAINEDQLGPYKVSPKTDIFIPIYFLHRNANYWQQPDTFDPDRFYKTDNNPLHKYAYIPFATGPRQCIGDYFSIVEMVLHVAAVAKYFRLKLCCNDPVELEAHVNLRTKKDLQFALELRSS